MQVPFNVALKPSPAVILAPRPLRSLRKEQRKNSGGFAVLSFLEPPSAQDFRGERDADGC